MPKDIHGADLKEGDFVLVPCKVTSVNESSDFVNVSLECLHPMPSSGTKPVLLLNSKQTVRMDDSQPSEEEDHGTGTADTD